MWVKMAEAIAAPVASSHTQVSEWFSWRAGHILLGHGSGRQDTNLLCQTLQTNHGRLPCARGKKDVTC